MINNNNIFMEFIIKNSGATEKISYHLTKYLK